VVVDGDGDVNGPRPSRRPSPSPFTSTSTTTWTGSACVRCCPRPDRALASPQEGDMRRCPELVATAAASM